MTILSTIATIVQDLLIFAGVLAVLLVATLIAVSRLPADNPLKRILVALSYRLAATLGAGLVAIPLEPIPGVDAVYDITAPIILIVYWLMFFRGLMKTEPVRTNPRSTSR
jgi:hypothetical protein